MRGGILRRIWITTSGAVVIVIGIVGIFLPVLPGIVLVVAGLALWSREYAWARRAIAPIHRRLRKGIDRVEERRPSTEEAGR